MNSTNNTTDETQIYNTDESTESATIQDIHNDLISFNNNLVAFGTTFIFLISVLIGVELGKVLKLWK